MKIYRSEMEMKDGTTYDDIWADRFSAISYCSCFDKYKNLKRGELYVMEIVDDSTTYKVTEYLIEYDTDGHYYHDCKPCAWWRESDVEWEEKTA